MPVLPCETYTYINLLCRPIFLGANSAQRRLKPRFFLGRRREGCHFNNWLMNRGLLTLLASLVGQEKTRRVLSSTIFPRLPSGLTQLDEHEESDVKEDGTEHE